MAKRMTDDEIMDYTYNKIFGDIDGIRSGSMFSDDKESTQGTTPNAGTAGMAGIDISITPRMAATTEDERPSDGTPEDEEEPKDKLKGIGRMSPLMAQLHGDR